MYHNIKGTHVWKHTQSYTKISKFICHISRLLRETQDPNAEAKVIYWLKKKKLEGILGNKSIKQNYQNTCKRGALGITIKMQGRNTGTGYVLYRGRETAQRGSVVGDQR